MPPPGTEPPGAELPEAGVFCKAERISGDVIGLHSGAVVHKGAHDIDLL